MILLWLLVYTDPKGKEKYFQNYHHIYSLTEDKLDASCFETKAEAENYLAAIKKATPKMLEVQRLVPKKYDFDSRN